MLLGTCVYVCVRVSVSVCVSCVWDQRRRLVRTKEEGKETILGLVGDEEEEEEEEEEKENKIKERSLRSTRSSFISYDPESSVCRQRSGNVPAVVCGGC